MESSQKKPVYKRIFSPINKFAGNSVAGGIVLFLSAVLAIVIANSHFSEAYHHFWEQHFGFSFLDLSLHHWINDGLMAIFFFVVGLELKREITNGELSNPRKAMLPIAAAFGGMVFPAIIYLTFNFQTEASSGWGIPMATDIAFALGVLHLLGNKIPNSLKVFLTALAIADDLGAVLVIAFFYTSDISILNLGIGLGLLVLLFLINKMKIRTLFIYVFIGIFVWYFFLMSGVHATIAAVLVAFTIPANTLNGISPLEKLEHQLQPFVAFVVMPVFAFANAGVTFSGNVSEELFSPVAIGVISGLLIGKFIGVVGVSTLMIKLKLADLPETINLRHLYGAGILASIGFTMSLFITNLAFINPEFIIQAKLGIFTVSLFSGILGFLILNKK